MKRYIIISIVVGMFMCSLVQINAADAHIAPNCAEKEWEAALAGATLVKTTVVNEYDLLVMEEAQMLKTRIRKDVVNTGAGKYLQDKAKLSNAELLDDGFTMDEISILRTYNGGLLSENPQLRSLFSEMSGSLYVCEHEPSRMEAMFSWQWTDVPLIINNTNDDLVVCGFIGVDGNNYPCAVETDSNMVTGIAFYYDTETGENTGGRQLTKDVSDMTYKASVDIELVDRLTASNTIVWAKRGYMKVAINDSAEANVLASATFAFGYAHSTVALPPSIDVVVGNGVSLGVALDFANASQEMYNGSIIINADGTYEVIE